MMEGSGSIQINYGSGADPEGPKTYRSGSGTLGRRLKEWFTGLWDPIKQEKLTQHIKLSNPSTFL
jgi:hypothetical protein